MPIDYDLICFYCLYQICGCAIAVTSLHVARDFVAVKTRSLDSCLVIMSFLEPSSHHSTIGPPGVFFALSLVSAQY